MTEGDSWYDLWTDGGARGNPGPAGIGAVLLGPAGEVVGEISQGIGWATNNVAEYQGLIEGMRLARLHDVKHLRVHMDSVLVVQQIRGAFKVKHPGLKPLHLTASTLAEEFDRISFEAVPRELNAHADRLMNEGIDAWLVVNERAEPPQKAQRGLF